MGQNFTTSLNILSAARFGLEFSHKSKKGDKVTICSIPVLGSKCMPLCHLRRGLKRIVLSTENVQKSYLGPKLWGFEKNFPQNPEGLYPAKEEDENCILISDLLNERTESLSIAYRESLTQ